MNSADYIQAQIDAEAVRRWRQDNRDALADASADSVQDDPFPMEVIPYFLIALCEIERAGARPLRPRPAGPNLLEWVAGCVLLAKALERDVVAGMSAVELAAFVGFSTTTWLHKLELMRTRLGIHAPEARSADERAAISAGMRVARRNREGASP